MIPVTTMEEVPIVSDAERADMIASLKSAKARVAAGHSIEHDPDRFVAQMMDIRAAALGKKAG